MGDSGQATAGAAAAVRIAAGEDLLGERRGLGINTIDYMELIGPPLSLE